VTTARSPRSTCTTTHHPWWKHSRTEVDHRVVQRCPGTREIS
jgi:hypothetical protein